MRCRIAGKVKFILTGLYYAYIIDAAIESLKISEEFVNDLSNFD